MHKYIHIGYPKNLSTTLQRDFFSKHPEILHLGVGVGSNIGYLDEDINLICENYLLYANERKYSSVKDFVQGVFSDYLNLISGTSSTINKKTVGISGELLSFKFSPDHVDSNVKAHRLKEIFGSDTSIIILIRNQVDLLKSLYREAIKIGYPETFQDFIEYTYYYQDRNFALDFCYDKTVALYGKLFGKENVHVLPIEEVRSKNGDLKQNSDGENLLVKWLCEILQISYADLELGHYNKALNSIALNHKMELNKKRQHDLGKPIYNAVNGHRMVQYFNKDLEVPLPKSLHKGLLEKRNSIDKAKKVSSNKNGGAVPIDYYADPYLMNKLVKLYSESNEHLRHMGISLPRVYDLG